MPSHFHNDSARARFAPPLSDEDAAFDQIVCDAVRRLERGEAVDLERITQEAPRQAARLTQILPTLQAMVDLGAEAKTPHGTERSGPSTGAPAASALGQIGDFQILRELGRGGMGVVYEAEQLSLSRRVALKVLPLAGILDEVQLKRFRNEARAAATLHHPHIVPVYAVGSDRGIHYYAMQLIEGQSLAQSIAALAGNDGAPGTASGVKTAAASADEAAALSETVACGADSTLRRCQHADDFRAIARLGIQAADALAYAHRQGILHRDIKPANLLVECSHLAPRDETLRPAERDGYKLWITDFGLAQMEADAGLTMSGDMLGTLRYMSPEQALGHGPVDQRTDVYSLGVTLYELIALRPAYDAVDRKQLLHDVAFAAPPPLSRLNPRVPADLATIIAKAIEREPADRYASCSDLADDLRRFVAGQPILARPPSYVDRAVKWSRRHVGVVWAAVASLIVVSAVLAVSTITIGAAWQDSQRSQSRLQEQLLATQKHLYRANIHAASQAWESARVDLVQQLLDESRPAAGNLDLRGWEWYYLKSLCHRDEATEPGGLTEFVDADAAAWLAEARGDSVVVRKFGEREVALTMPRLNVETMDVVVMSPDGRWAVYYGRTWDERSELEIWNVDERRREKRIELPGENIMDVAWSPDGQKFATAHSSQEVHIWDASTGKVVGHLQGLEGFDIVWSVAWSPDGALLAVATNAGLVGVFDAATGERLHTMDGHGGIYTEVAFSPDGRRLASCGNDQLIKIWNPRTGQLERAVEAHNGRVAAVAWSPDSQRLASGGEDSLVKIWNTDGEIQNTLRGHRGTVQNLAWLDADRLASSCRTDGETKLWRVADDQRALVVPGRSSHCWMPSGQSVLWYESDHETGIHQFDLSSRASTMLVEDREHPGAAVLSIDVDPSGRRVAAVSDGRVLVWDLRDPRACRTLRPSSRCVAWSPDSRRLAVTDAGGVHLYDTATWECVASLRRGGDEAAGTVAWSPDGSTLAVVKWNTELQLWDVATGRLVHQVPFSVGTEFFTADGSPGASWNPAGDRIAVRSGGWVLIVDAATGDEVSRFHAHLTNMRTVAWSPDGARIATGGEDRLVKIWNPATGAELLTLQGRQRKVFGVSWSPDGAVLASSGYDGVYIWDASPAYAAVR